MIEIIPAIDIMDGKCVRLEQGDYNRRKEYGMKPVDVAKEFEDAGIRRIHMVDLDGAKEQSTQNLKVLETIRKNTRLELDFSGGIRSSEQIETLFTAGADLLTVGSLALKNPDEFKTIINDFGPERFILAADSKDGMVASHGWLEKSSVALKDFVTEYKGKGIREVMCTDISKDGMLQGVETALYQKLRDWFPCLQIIASGGVTGYNDLKKLDQLGIDKVIVGKALYEKRIDLKTVYEKLLTE